MAALQRKTKQFDQAMTGVVAGERPRMETSTKTRTPAVLNVDCLVHGFRIHGRRTRTGVCRRALRGSRTGPHPSIAVQNLNWTCAIHPKSTAPVRLDNSK